MITKKDWLRWLAICIGLVIGIIATLLFPDRTIIAFFGKAIVMLLIVFAAAFIFSNEEKILAKRLEANEGASETRERRDSRDAKEYDSLSDAIHDNCDRDK